MANLPAAALTNSIDGRECAPGPRAAGAPGPEANNAACPIPAASGSGVRGGQPERESTKSEGNPPSNSVAENPAPAAALAGDSPSAPAAAASRPIAPGLGAATVASSSNKTTASSASNSSPRTATPASAPSAPLSPPLPAPAAPAPPPAAPPPAAPPPAAPPPAAPPAAPPPAAPPAAPPAPPEALAAPAAAAPPRPPPPPPPPQSTITVSSTSTVNPTLVSTSIILTTSTSTVTAKQPSAQSSEEDAAGAAAPNPKVPQPIPVDKGEAPPKEAAPGRESNQQDPVPTGNFQAPPIAANSNTEKQKSDPPKEVNKGQESKKPDIVPTGSFQTPPIVANPGQGSQNPGPAKEVNKDQESKKQDPVPTESPQKTPPIVANPGQGPQNSDPAKEANKDQELKKQDPVPIESPKKTPSIVANPDQGPQNDPPKEANKDQESKNLIPIPAESAQTPPAKATEGQESQRQSLSTSTSTQSALAENPARPSLPPSGPLPGTNIDLKNDGLARNPETTPLGPGSSDSKEGDGVSSTRTTLETIASAVTSGTATSRTSVASQTPSLQLGDTVPGNISGPNDSQNNRPLGGQPGGLGNSGKDNPNIEPPPKAPSSSPRSLSTGSIVGISVGGFAALSLIILLLWLWRRRLAKRRGDTLPTSRGWETNANGFSGEASEASKRTEILAAVFGHPGGGARSQAGASDSPRVNINRGPSQFLENQVAPEQEDNTAARPVSYGLTVKDRVLDWWSRRAEDKDFDTRVRGDRGGSPPGHVSEQSGSSNMLPEFGPGPDMSLGGFRSLDPFSDVHATHGDAAYSAQLARSRPSDPFADPSSAQLPPQGRNDTGLDAPAIPSRSRARDVGATVRSPQHAPPSMAFQPSSGHGDTLRSEDSFADRRNKFRSDPFDLELEGRLVPSADAIAQMPRQTGLSSTYSSHTHVGSLDSSQYTSGISISDWGEAAGAYRGPETVPAAGTAAARGYDSPTLTEDPQPEQGARRSNDKNGERTGVGVGQAL